MGLSSSVEMRWVTERMAFPGPTCGTYAINPKS